MSGIRLASFNDMPKPYTGIPNPEVTGGAPGVNDNLFAPGLHQHPRLTSAQQGIITDVNGFGTATFTRSFSVKPCPLFSCEGMDGVSFTVTSWQQDGQNNYIGCTFRATRRSASTSTTGVVVLSITVLATLNTTNADVPVANLSCSVIMLQQS